MAYAHVPNELRKKLDNKGEKCIFVGYSEDTNDYKLYNPITRKVIINRDVQFIEEEAWDGSLEKTVSIITGLPQDDSGVLTLVGIPSMAPHSMPTKAQQGGL